MLRSVRRLFGVVAAVSLSSAPLTAQYPGLTAEYVERVGTGTTTSSFEVWVRLTLAANAPALTFDGGNPGDRFGLPNEVNLPASGWNGIAVVPFASYTSAYTNTAYTCSGNFTNVCSPGAYAWNFHTDNGNPARPSFNFRTLYDLLPGESEEFLFGTFTPVGGVAAPGTYRVYNIFPILSVFGVDANGTSMSSSVELDRMCTTGDDSCAFTRTVSAVAVVPEPSTMMLTAFGLVAAAAAASRRREKKTA